MKERYSPPSIEVLGRLEELTQDIKYQGAKSDGDFLNIGTKKHPILVPIGNS